MRAFPAFVCFLAFLATLTAGCAPAESRNANALADSVIGVVQCDQYLAQVNACLGTLPAARRATLSAEARATFLTWKEAAAHPQHRQALPQACTITHELAREELAPLGCRL